MTTISDDMASIVFFSLNQFYKSVVKWNASRAVNFVSKKV